MTTVATPTEHRAVADHRTRRRTGLGGALRFELRKLRAQYRTRAILLGAVLLPIPVVLVVHAQTRPPKDTLFGRYAPDNGFALALLVLGFAAQWLMPLLTAMVAGEVFAGEDQHGTWKTVLTRSTSRTTLFWAKTLVASAFAVVEVALLTASTIGTSLLVVGQQPLVGLSGQTVAPAHALTLVVAAWASTLPPVLGFTALALALSVWFRSTAVGIAAPVVIAMVMQLLGSVGGLDAVRPYLLSTPFEAWHGLLASPPFTDTLVQGLLVSAAWCVLTLGGAWYSLRRRDITGG